MEGAPPSAVEASLGARLLEGWRPGRETEGAPDSGPEPLSCERESAAGAGAGGRTGVGGALDAVTCRPRVDTERDASTTTCASSTPGKGGGGHVIG